MARKKPPTLYRKCDCRGCDRCQRYAGRCERETMIPEKLYSFCQERAEELKGHSGSR